MRIRPSKIAFQQQPFFPAPQSSIILAPIVRIDDICARDHAKQFILFNMRILQPLKSL